MREMNLMTRPRRYSPAEIVDLLRTIHSRYWVAVQTGGIWLGSEHQRRELHVVRDAQLAECMDSTRAEISHRFYDMCEDAGMPPLGFRGSVEKAIAPTGSQGQARIGYQPTTLSRALFGSSTRFAGSWLAR